MIQIQKIAVDKLTLHPQNPRKIDEAQFEKLCQSLKDNPDLFDARPCLVNPQMVVFGGNMRLRAARKLGWKEVPCAVMDVSKERQDEMMIRDNRQNGMWDWGILGATFEPAKLQEWGFTEFELGMGTDSEYGSKNKEISAEEVGAGTHKCPRCGFDY